MPEEVRIATVKLRFWQLAATEQQLEDWAIDSFIFESTLNMSRSGKPETLALIDARAETDDAQNAPNALIDETTQNHAVTLKENDINNDDLQQTSAIDIQPPELSLDDDEDDFVQQSHQSLSIFDIRSKEDDTQQFQSDEPPDLAASKNLSEILTHKLWWRKANCAYVGEYCKQRGRIMQGKSTATEESVLETSDFFAESLGDRLLSFDVFVGSCNSRPEQFDQPYQLRFPLRLEVSFDHGVTWTLFHSLKLRGETGVGPQSPSVFVQLGKWKTYRYALDHLSGFKYDSRVK